MSNVTVKLTGDEARLLASLDKVIAKERQLALAAGEVGDRSERAGRRGVSGLESLGAAAAAVVGRIASVGAALATITRIVRDLDAQAEEIAAKHRGAERGLSSLAQLAGGNKNNYQQLVATAREMYKRGQADSQDEAANMVFALESAGMLQEREAFGSLRGVIRDPGAMASAVATLRTSMGKAETGSAQDIISKGFAASHYAPASVEEILQAGAKSGGYASSLRMSDEEVLAAVAIASKGLGGAAEGGTAVQAFLKELVRNGNFTGLGLRGSLEKIAARKMTPQATVKYLGRAEAFQAYNLLSRNMPMLEEIIAAENAAQQGNLATTTAELPTTDAEISAVRQRQRSEAALELSAGEKAAIKNRIKAAVAQQEAIARMQGVPETLIGITRAFDWIGESLNPTTEQTARRLEEGIEQMKRQPYQAPDIAARRRRYGADAYSINVPPGIEVDVRVAPDQAAGIE